VHHPQGLSLCTSPQGHRRRFRRRPLVFGKEFFVTTGVVAAADPAGVPPEQAETPTCAVALTEVQGEAADLPVMFAAITDAVGAVVAVEEVSGSGEQRRLRLSGGARVRLSAGPPVEATAAAAGALTVALVLDERAALCPVQVQAILRAVRWLPFTSTEMRALRALPAQMPLTAGLPHFVPSACLTGVAPVLTVHHMTDFLVMVEAVRAMGVPASAITVLDKGYRYRLAPRVDAQLAADGIAVWPWTRAAEALADHVRRAGELGRQGLLIDDGGYTLPVLLRERPDLVSAFCGLVEQTTSGITRLEPWGGAPAAADLLGGRVPHEGHDRVLRHRRRRHPQRVVAVDAREVRGPGRAGVSHF
jgi:hypothetical protein